MQLKLKLLSTANFITGKPTDIDLFDARGILLLAKGKPVSPQIVELLHNRELYIIEYQWKQEQTVMRTFSPDTYKKILDSIQRIYFDAHLVNTKTLFNIMEIVDGIINELEKLETFSEKYKIYVNFNHFRAHDNYTYIHSVNVAIIATLIGAQLGYPGKSIHNLCLGALLHDIGKLMIPASILQKPAGLTPDEFEIVKQHPIHGYEMLRGGGFPSEILFAIRQHHERWNGQGYPDRLIKRGIHPFAQIVAIADVFDALTADRPYRKGFPPYHALEMVIAGSATDFAPDMVKAFRGSLVIYPENSIVTLNTGEVGKVISVPDNNPTRPLIRILFDKWGNFVNDDKEVDLLEDLTRFINEVEFLT